MSDLNKFWLQYVDIVELLYNNLMAERCGMWDMYKYSLKKMLPYLAGTGRNKYTRSVYWFPHRGLLFKLGPGQFDLGSG